MKIFFNRVPRTDPYGGGNQFLQVMTSTLEKNGHQVVYHLEKDVDLIFMMDPRPGDIGYSVQHIAAYKNQFPETKILHRVNECDARKGTNEIDQLLLASMNLSDRVVFISEWLKQYFKNLGYNKSSDVIYNGCNTDHFFPKEKALGKKIKLVTHHWSDNWMKGFDLYTQIDKYIRDNPDTKIEFTYVGRYCKEYTPTHTKIVQPLSGAPLGEEIRKHDVYVTASRWEPCGMHHIEGAASGLPVLYHKDSGGIVELCEKHGMGFYDFESFMKSLEVVSSDYSRFVKLIDYENLKIEKCCNSFYNIIEETVK